jgi:hypothetical protein
MQNHDGQASWHTGRLRPRVQWLQWAEVLRRYRLDGVASWLLDAGRPFALLSAQLLYIGRPFLGEGAETLAHMLESEDEAHKFASFLDPEKHGADGESFL